MVVKEDDIAGALARAYCTPENSKKEMDSDLLIAMTKELMVLQRGAEYRVFDYWLKRDYEASQLNEITIGLMWDAWQTRGDSDQYGELYAEILK